MPKAEPVWTVRNADDLNWFLLNVLMPLIAATRPPDLRTDEALAVACRAWLASLPEIPPDVLRAGVARLLASGQTWMPRPGDLRTACAAFVAERRREKAPEAAKLIAECEACHGSTWRELFDTDGRSRGMVRCDCQRAALEALKGLPQPIALPPAEREDGAA